MTDSNDENGPITLRDMVIDMRATLNAHLLEDNRRWDAIAGELKGLNGRLWGMVIGTISLAVVGLGTLLLEFLTHTTVSQALLH